MQGGRASGEDRPRTLYSVLRVAPQCGQTFQAESAGFPQLLQTGCIEAPQCGQ